MRPWEARESDAQRLHRSFPAAEAAGLLAPGEDLVAGRHPVEEALIAGRRARRLLVVPHRREALERIVLHATQLRIPIVEVEGGTLTALAGFDGHQGIAVVFEERRFASLEDLLARAIERGEPPFVLVLDSLEDPQNLGSLLRSAEAAGAHGVVFPIRRQAPLTPAAVKASAGAVEHLLLVPVDDLAGALADLHVRGIRVVGAEADAALTHREADMRGPLALVVGHEGQGLGPAVRRRCDLLVRIPMRGRISSLNAAVAGSILLFEASGQRGEVPPPPPPVVRDVGDEGDDGAPTIGEPAATPPPTEVPAAEVPSRPMKPRRSKAAEPAPPAASEEPGADDELLPGGPALPSVASEVVTPDAARGPKPKRGRKAAAAEAQEPSAPSGPKPKRGRRAAATAAEPARDAEPTPKPKRGRKAAAAAAQAPGTPPGPKPKRGRKAAAAAAEADPSSSPKAKRAGKAGGARA